MSNRTLRVNELIQRELSEILRKRYQSEAVALTITGVHIAPDLRDGRVFVAITGDAEFAADRLRWLKSKAHDIRFELGRRIVLKYMPQLTYVLDQSTAKGNQVLQLLDELDKQSPLENPDDIVNEPESDGS
jgi:ribosome-binding factor A